MLDALSDDFPEEFFKMKILPELLKSVEFGGGGPKVFAAILKIGQRLSDDEYGSRLVPVIIRLFSSPDRAMRVFMLENLPLMIDRLSQKDINKMFPMLITGFTDSAPLVRDQTVKSVLVIIGKLSDRVVNGELLRYLAKTANDEQPGIRTNTTICLGKIARNLGSGTRSKVLIAAFTRSLRDPFIHARNAALMALCATIDIYSEDDCATKILPVLCLSLIDKDKIVRDQANKTLDTYLQRVRKYTATMADTRLLPLEKATGAAQPTRIESQTDPSWAGWAISSFTGKLASARGDMQTAIPPGTQSRPSSQPVSGQVTPAVQMTSAPPPTALTAPVVSEAVVVPEETWGGNDDDAWSTVGDENDSFFDTFRVRKKTPERVSGYDDGAEPDFAGWLVTQNQTKKGPLSKSMGRSEISLKPRHGVGKGHSAGATSTGTGAQRMIAPTSKVVAVPVVKKAVIKKAEEVNDDDWGDAWD